MNFIPIGITSESNFKPDINAANFSDEKYDGVQIREGVKNKMVLIMHSKKTTPLEWKVVYGSCSVFFNSFQEAVSFCEERGMRAIRRNK